MALPETGVKLVAENERGFLASLVRSNKAVSDFESGTKSASVGTIALGTAIGNIVANGFSLLTRAATDAGRALVGFVGQGINEAAALEAQMSGIAAVTGASAEEMEALNTLIMDLGLDPNLTVSTVEAAQAIEMLGKNGVSVADILDGMALSTVQLANSTGADFATAADLATDTMSLFRGQGIEMSDAVNGITAVVNSSKFGINDYALALANGGATAAALGVELEDFNALLTGISPSFTSGATAGTAMKNMLLRLTPATNKAADEMQMLGLITEDGSNVFFDSEGNMKSMSEVAAILSNSLSGLSEQQKASTLKTIFGNDAMEAVLATMTAGAPLYDDVASAMDGLGLSFDEATAFIEAGGNQIALASMQMQNVDAADSAATRVDNFAGAMDILGGIIEGVRIQIGTKFLPVLTDLSRRAAEFVESNAQPFIDAFSNIADGVAIFLENLTQGGGLFESFSAGLTAILPQDMHEKFVEISTAIGDFIAQIVTFVSEHKDTFIGALKGIGAVLAGAAIASTIASIAAAIGTLFSPIGLIIATAALLGAAWENNWGGIREKTEEVINFIKPFIEEAITTIKTWWAENGDEILAKASETWEGVKETVNTVLTFIRDEIITPWITAIQEFWDKHGESIKETFTLLWEQAKAIIDTALKNITAIFGIFKAAFEGDWKTFGTKLRELWDNTWEFFKESMDTFLPQLKEKAATFIEEFKEKFTEVDWKEVGTNIIEGIKQGLLAAKDGFISAATDIAQAGIDATKGFFGIDSPSKVFMGIGQNLGTSMAMGMNSTGGAVATASTAMASRATSPIATVATPSQIMNSRTTNINNRTINFTGNYNNNPTITDADSLTRAIATA